MTPDISIIICTFNRFHCLKLALKSLQDQKFEKNNFEILIVDAGSEDQISEIINNFSIFLPIHFFSVPHLGLSDARNFGIRNASGNIIAFLDDDAIADPSWLEQIQTIFRENETYACGGKSILLSVSPFPQWLNKRMSGFLGQFDYGKTGFFMDDPNENPGGLNMAFRKEAFDLVGYFNPNLGRSGGNLLSNEEVDLFRKMRRKKLKIYYNPKMLVFHHVSAERLTKEFFYRRYYWQGRSDAVMNLNEEFFINRMKKIILRIIIIPFRPLKVSFFTKFNSKEQKRVVLRCTWEYDRGYLYRLVNRI
jgi:glycosyltransferase involved in cell wall biosynthesis